MIEKINLLWKTISEKLNDAPVPKSTGDSMASKNTSSISHIEREELRRKGIKSPSKLFSPKYVSPASIIELDKNPSAPKHVHFVNSIVILGKESKAREEETMTDITPEHGHNIIKEAKVEVKEVIDEEESEVQTDEEVEEILEEEEEDEDDEYMQDGGDRRGISHLMRLENEMMGDREQVVDKYISGLPDNIYGNVKSLKPKTLDETIELANDLMDQKLRTYAKRKFNSKRKADDISRNNQQPFKKQNVAKANNLGSVEKKTYEGNAPKSTGNTNATNNRGDNGPNPRGNGCFECGNPGHFKRDCPKLNNKNGEMGMLKDGCMLWVMQRGMEIPQETRTQMSSRVHNHYDVELADGKIVGINTIIRGCTLNFLNHPFTIDLMPIELGSFDAIIDMDWLKRHHAVIVCVEKLVRVPFGNETLVFRGAKSYIGRESQLTVISCSKVQEYRAKGCHVFLAQISTTKEDDKSEGKHFKDVPIVQDFPEVFPENLPGLPLARPVEFQIDLIPRAAPVARAPYRLAPSEMKELSKQLQELSDKGFIRPSSSPWGAPVLFIKKKDG
nr:hypothetical protein [Tanacetum cinerariifolium]